MFDDTERQSDEHEGFSEFLTAADQQRLTSFPLPELTGDFYVIKPTYDLIRTGRQVWNEREGRYTEATHWAVTGWSVVGTATSISDAKRQGFFAPVLQDCKSFDEGAIQQQLLEAQERMYLYLRTH